MVPTVGVMSVADALKMEKLQKQLLNRQITKINDRKRKYVIEEEEEEEEYEDEDEDEDEGGGQGELNAPEVHTHTIEKNSSGILCNSYNLLCSPDRVPSRYMGYPQYPV